LAATYFGGSANDMPYSIAVDSSGNVYVAGQTYSTDLPTTSGAYDQTYNGGDYEAFVARFDSNLGSLLSSSYIGGGRVEAIYDMALDSSGNVYVCGTTNSYSPDFPTTSGAYSTTYHWGMEAFVSRFNPDLSTLNASTFIDNNSLGTINGYAYALALDGTGDNVYVACTLSEGTTGEGVNSLADGYDTTYNGLQDVYLIKLNSALTTRSHSTFLGGTNHDRPSSMLVDGSGNVYVAGYTYSSDLPTTTGAYDEAFGGGDYDAFVSQLDCDLQNLVTSTYLGGTNNDVINDILIEGSSLYAAGYTYSSDFPVTAGSYSTTFHGGDYDCFLTELNTGLTGLAESTFLGCYSYDSAVSLLADGSGSLYVGGWTYSPGFPVTAGAYDTVLGDPPRRLHCQDEHGSRRWQQPAQPAGQHHPGQRRWRGGHHANTDLQRLLGPGCGQHPCCVPVAGDHNRRRLLQHGLRQRGGCLKPDSYHNSLRNAGLRHNVLLARQAPGQSRRVVRLV